MKKCTFCLIAGLLLPVLAAEAQHQVYLGAGAASERDFTTSGIWKQRVEGGGSTRVNSSGAYHLGYRYNRNEREAVGLLLTGESLNVVKTGSAMPENEGKYKEWNDLHTALLLDYRYSWALRPASRWYSGISPGVSWHRRREAHNDFESVKDEFDKARFAYQVTAVGFGFGRKVGGYVELGYGYKGLLSAGVSYGF